MRGIFNGYVIGNAVRPVEVRQYNGGQVGSTTLAINDGKKNSQNVQYVKVKFWNKTADTAGQYIQKGTPVFCAGRIEQESYKDRNGVERQNVALNVIDFQLLGFSKGGQAQQRQNYQTQQYTPQQTQQIQQFGSMPQDSGLNDDIPF